MLTSRPPHELGLFNNGDVVAAKHTLITDVLRKNGYHSAAFVSLGVLDGAFGLKRGFKVYEDTVDIQSKRFYKVAAEINAIALPWFEENKDERFFAWLHYSDPHEPYVTADAPPDTEIFVNGKSVGRYVLGKKEKIAISFTANPGENKIEFHALVPRGPKKIQTAESMRHLYPNSAVVPSEGIDFDFGPEFNKVMLSTGIEVHSFVNYATMMVKNLSSTPKSVQLRFAGGIFLQRTEQVRQNYAAEVQYVDKHIGELWDLLDKLGLLKNSILILTADHGEGLKTHGTLGHVQQLFQETVRVPLIIYYPNLGKRGKVESPIVNHMDIMPTVLDLLHVKHKGVMKGLSLKRHVSWSPIDWLISRKIVRPRTFTATFSPEARFNSFTMVDGHLKLIHTPKRSKRQWQAFDLKQDPTERKNIAIKDVTRFKGPEFSRLQAILQEFQREAESAHGKHTNPELSPEDQEMLRGLGYVGGDNNNKSPQEQEDQEEE
jgi:hypothetical protein